MTTIPKTKVGLIGCGNISAIYLQAPAKFGRFEIVACADIELERAQARAAEYGIAKACTVDEILSDPEIEVILNLTIPAAHAEVALAALAAGKSVYTEKPLATTREAGRQVLELAEAKGLRVGCAPDTFLGAGLQTCRKLIDEGAIGQPLAATAFMGYPGPERWHPNPEFFYQPGAGPLFDMGPYYLTALINLLGPVQRVTASAQALRKERIVTNKINPGAKIAVNTPTHISGTLDFTNGAVASLITSFDVAAHNIPNMEIYGTEGTLSVPDPNGFGGPVRLRQNGDSEWREISLTLPYDTNSRGLGIADMIYSMQNGLPHQASGKLAYHVLDIMESLLESSSRGQHLNLTSGVERPGLLPLELYPAGHLATK